MHNARRLTEYIPGHESLRGGGAGPPRVLRRDHEVVRGRPRHAVRPAAGRGPAVQRQQVRGHHVCAAGAGRGGLHLLPAIQPGGLARRQPSQHHCIHSEHRADHSLQHHLHRAGHQADRRREPPHRHHVRGRADREAVRLPVHQLVHLFLLHRIHRTVFGPPCRSPRLVPRPVRGRGLHAAAGYQHGHHLRHATHTDQLPGCVPAVALQKAQVPHRDQRNPGRQEADSGGRGLHVDGVRQHD
mmetsp:Transcript_10190/g.14026  ORF Transcript_10190/g.14026 Transcript_10190/m.14026 type:complete len:242 (+) Transcript_10190:1152-1877(+)